MASKYMSVKRIVIPFLTMLIIVAQITGCSPLNSKEAAEIAEETPEIVVEVSKMEDDYLKAFNESNKMIENSIQLAEDNNIVDVYEIDEETGAITGYTKDGDIATMEGFEPDPLEGFDMEAEIAKSLREAGVPENYNEEEDLLSGFTGESEPQPTEQQAQQQPQQLTDQEKQQPSQKPSQQPEQNTNPTTPNETPSGNQGQQNSEIPSDLPDWALEFWNTVEDESAYHHSEGGLGPDSDLNFG